MNKRLFVFLLTAILLVVSVFPVKAEAQRIPISGKLYIIAICDDVTIACAVDYRYWETRFGAHWRNQVWLMYVDAGDSPLTGYTLGDDSWNLFHNGPYWARNGGKSWSTDAQGNPTDLWESTSLGRTDWVGNQIVDVVSIGKGANQGLLAKFTLTPTTMLGVYDVTGELLIPGR